MDFARARARLHRLTAADRGELAGSPDYTGIAPDPSRAHAYALDALGNWSGYERDEDGSPVIDQTRTHNLVNEIDAVTGSGASDWIDPAYDAAGNMIEAPAPGDEDGTRHWYVWDAWNRLVAVWEDDGDGTPEITGETPADTLLAEYRYDGLHRRIVELVPKGSDWDRTDYYYNAQWQVLEERFNADQADPDVPAADPKCQYVWDPRYIDAAVLRWRDENDDGDFLDAEETLYYTQDANSGVTALVNPADGGVEERYVYDPYGEVTVYSGDWLTERDESSFANEVLFSGYRYSPESGLYDVRRRPYHPTLGRWLSRDPSGQSIGPGSTRSIRQANRRARRGVIAQLGNVGPHTGDVVIEYADGMNLQEYVRSNPIVLADAFGLEALGLDLADSLLVKS
jgi:RHS repeat-associated protein